MSTKPYLIFAPSFDNKSGGVIALHKLCHLLNCEGLAAFLVKPFSESSLTIFNRRKVVRKIRKEKRLYRRSRYHTNPAFNTPVIAPPDRSEIGNYIAIYPDTTPGNPLQANHVVRWFLHRPGYHTGKVSYDTTDIIYDYRTFLESGGLPGATHSPLKLEITHTPTEIYNMEGAVPMEARSGTAYCIKKGRGRRLIHDTADSILIDELTHEEIAAVFKRVKTFISYDTYTSYLLFAALCGADAVVIPEDGIDKEQWHSNPNTRYGIAYGLDDMEWARRTRALLSEETLRRESQQRSLVVRFIEETQTHFDQSPAAFPRG